MAVKPITMPFGNAVLVYTSFGIIINISSLIIAGILAGYIPAKIVAREDILKSIWG
jgi:ABC-type antimicrobial peptide transport system permease subunit